MNKQIKSIFSGLLSVGLLLSLCVVFPANTVFAAASYVGDVDADGTVTASDARTALRASVGLQYLDTTKYGIADADGDSVVTASDARTILRTSVGLENKVSLSSSFTYSHAMFTLTLPAKWRGKYKAYASTDGVEFRHTASNAKLFDITFVPDSSYFADGITDILKTVSGKKSGYLISYAVTDSPDSGASEYRLLFSDVGSIKASLKAVSGYTFSSPYSVYKGIFANGNMSSGPAYFIDITSVSGDTITFEVIMVGYNASPYYVTSPVTVTLKNGTGSFSWSDSWDNRGTGTVTLSNYCVTVNMKQTYTASVNRGTLATNGDKVLFRE